MNLFYQCLFYLERKLLTSIFFSYQSPIILLHILEKIEYMSTSSHIDLKRRINVGDRVKFFDKERKRHYQVIIVCTKRNNPDDGLISFYSYLGSSILGLAEEDMFKLYVLGKERKYKITSITSEKSINHKSSLIRELLL